MANSIVPTKSNLNKSLQSVYEAPQQVQYLYLQAEIDVLLCQLEACKSSQN